MAKYECQLCGFVYDEQQGIPGMGFPVETRFEELPSSFACPICGAGKEAFSIVSSNAAVGSEQSKRINLTVAEIISRTPTIKSFRFALPEVVPFKPGQYLVLSIDGRDDLKRPLSISNSPTEQGYLEVTKRITSSDFSQRLNSAQPGLEVSIDYPFGAFTFEGELEKVAFLSGGIGITPLRSMCRYLTDKNLTVDICLLYGNRSSDEIPFKDDFEEMQKIYPALRVVHTVSSSDPLWKGRVGKIDSAQVKEEIPDYIERTFFICGPPPMVDAMQQMLRCELNIPESQIKIEHFVGY